MQLLDYLYQELYDPITMKKPGTLLLLFLAHFAGAQDLFDKIFVDQSWLLEHQNDRNLVLLHVAEADHYKKGHIENAQLIVPDEYTVTRGNLRWELPDSKQLEATLRSKGISHETVNVLYYAGDLFAPTFRLYFTLDYLGLGDNTFILNGGLPGWLAQKLPVTTELTNVTQTGQGKLLLTPRKHLLAMKDEVLARSKQSSTSIIDARKSDYYRGEKDGDGRYRRSGHIAGAVNITWRNLLDENKFVRNKEDLRKYFDEAGVKKKKKVITYCHVGLSATVLYTIAKALGHETRLYDGSFSEWDKLDASYLVETGN